MGKIPTSLRYWVAMAFRIISLSLKYEMHSRYLDIMMSLDPNVILYISIKCRALSDCMPQEAPDGPVVHVQRVLGDS